MARRLPWKTSDIPKTSSPRAAPKAESPSAPVKRRSPSLPRTPTIRKRERAVIDSDPIRSPSTSPPPEPPQERFMIPGALHDDRFRMVEDEFLHTAQLFTTHLHRAEYSRLKTLARTQSAAAIREIERPVVGALTSTARRRAEGVKRVAKQRKVLQDDGSDAPWMGTSLQGLMESPSKQTTALTSYPSGGVANTRAAAGLGSGHTAASGQRRVSAGRPRSSGSDTGGSPEVLASAPRTTGKTSAEQTGADGRSRTWPKPSPRRKSPTRTFPLSARTPSYASLKDQGETRSDRAKDDDEDDDDDPFGMKNRRIRYQKSREQLRKPKESQTPKKAEPDTMPSFL